MRNKGEISPRISRGSSEQVEFAGAGSVMVVDGDVVHQSEGKIRTGSALLRREAVLDLRIPMWSPSMLVSGRSFGRRWLRVALRRRIVGRSGDVLREKGEERLRRGWALYSRAWLGWQARVCEGGGLRSDGGDARHARGGHRPGEEETDGWVPPVSGGRSRARYPFGLG
jgi:hypothetical protein